jgi:hypothetical protein
VGRLVTFHALPQPGYGFWLRLQLDFELMRAARETGELLNREVQPHAA